MAGKTKPAPTVITSLKMNIPHETTGKDSAPP
eukprot:CAMPEP_0172595134 /NCGR_PEP_ID=MMETSP1068-20121228/14707_1 /TAXON_ID=35684 /ORGANISM="Pseudopedinella elastica, Strain CCMP716" /LENGTH=31 /DNA_ID= /DNA_START= /DNA_END= /DNA_ORIENTATION=